MSSVQFLSRLFYITLKALLPMLRDDDVETAAAATHGVTRLALS
jgi:hypothetical protein